MYHILLSIIDDGPFRRVQYVVVMMHMRNCPSSGSPSLCNPSLWEVVLAIVIIIACTINGTFCHRLANKPHAPFFTPYYYLLFGWFLIPLDLGCLRVSLENPHGSPSAHSPLAH